jgi:hypothetical protein
MHADKDLRGMLERLKHDLNAFPSGMNYLDVEFESAAKHIPAYLKIVKGHIEQLATVLGLETHDNRKLESVGLAEPVIQLMQLFRELEDKDIQLIESLAHEARNWTKTATTEPVKAAATV